MANRKYTSNPLDNLNLTEDEMKRYQALRLHALADQVVRDKTLAKFGLKCAETAGPAEMTDTDFLLSLIERAVTSDRLF